MSANIKLIVEYEGTGFHGWQQQAGSVRTVEGCLRQAIEDLTGERPALIAAGRTDAGVHALGQCVNFRLERPFPPEQLAGALNSRLAPDVRVRRAELAGTDFHARYSAKSRLYHYRVRQSTPWGAYARQYAWAVKETLNLAAMRAAAARLEGVHDFRAFGRSPRPGGHTRRRIYAVRVDADGGWVTIAVAANAFLYGMVRAVAAALVDVGRSRRPIEWIDELLESGAPRTGLRPAPPEGLVQVAVDY